MKRLRRLWLIGLFLCLLLVIGSLALQALLANMAGRPIEIGSWATSWNRSCIDRSELQSGGPGKDGIPALTAPTFVSVEQAGQWINADEPFVYLSVVESVRAYPIQILIWHEIVNDLIGDIPVAVTFCPLCNSALVFDRRVNGHTFIQGKGLSERLCLVLTNGTEPLLNRMYEVIRLQKKPNSLRFRISLDYPESAQHDAGRGKGHFRMALKTLVHLHDQSFPVSISRREIAGENREALNAGYRPHLQAVGLPTDFLLYRFLISCPQVPSHRFSI